MDTPAEVTDIPGFSGPSIILGWLSCSGNLCANIRGPSFWTSALSWTNCKPCWAAGIKIFFCASSVMRTHQETSCIVLDFSESPHPFPCSGSNAPRILDLNCGGTFIRARVSDGDVPREGAVISITARAQDIHLFDKATRRRFS